MTTFVIEQVPGSLVRSHHVDGVEESLVRSKKYMLPLVLLTPHIATAAVVGYLVNGRLRLPKDPAVLAIRDDLPVRRHSLLVGQVAPDGQAGVPVAVAVGQVDAPVGQVRASAAQVSVADLGFVGPSSSE